MKQVRITLSYFKQKIVYITHSCAFFSFTSGKVTFCQSVGRSLGCLVVWLFGRCKYTQRRDNPRENISLCFCRMFQALVSELIHISLLHRVRVYTLVRQRIARFTVDCIELFDFSHFLCAYCRQDFTSLKFIT